MTDADYPTLVLRDPEDELDALLRDAQGFVFQHPVAAQALYATLVTEGRRLSATAEGQVLRARLAKSPLARRWREAWEAGTLNALDGAHEGPLPSDFGDLLFAAAASGRPLLGSLFSGSGV